MSLIQTTDDLRTRRRNYLDAVDDLENGVGSEEEVAEAKSKYFMSTEILDGMIEENADSFTEAE